MKTKKIEIKNINDYNKFIKKLKWYRLFIYKRVNFSCSSNKLFKDIESIIDSLNIKNKRKRIEYIYDYSCNYIDNYCKNKDFCKFKDNKCLNQYDKKLVNGCCRGCRYQSSNGCLTSNLTCKLFYCHSVKEKNKVIEYKDLNILKVLSKRNRVIIKHNFFVDRETYLKDLYLNSVIIFSIKELFRLRHIKSSIKKNK